MSPSRGWVWSKGVPASKDLWAYDSSGSTSRTPTRSLKTGTLWWLASPRLGCSAARSVSWWRYCPVLPRGHFSSGQSDLGCSTEWAWPLLLQSTRPNLVLVVPQYCQVAQGTPGMQASYRVDLSLQFTEMETPVLWTLESTFPCVGKGGTVSECLWQTDTPSIVPLSLALGRFLPGQCFAPWIGGPTYPTRQGRHGVEQEWETKSHTGFLGAEVPASGVSVPGVERGWGRAGEGWRHGPGWQGTQ